MKIAVIGAGAIGSLFGGYLSLVGFDVSLVVREGIRADILRVKGVHITGVKDDVMVFPKIVLDASEIGEQDLVIVCVKSYQTKEAIMQHRALIGEKTLVLSMQNGVGNVEQIAEIVGQENVLAGSTTNGAYITEDGVVHHVGDGDTLIGELSGGTSERIEKMADCFKDTMIDVSVSEDIAKILYTKLAINCAINPLTALLRVQNGDVFYLENLKGIAENAVLEVADLADAKGIELDRDALVERMFEVARLTEKNRSSMLKDVLAKRETEIEAICGAVDRFGKELNIATPYNTCLYGLIAATSASCDKRLS